jgi:hypothetical protein
MLFLSKHVVWCSVPRAQRPIISEGNRDEVSVHTDSAYPHEQPTCGNSQLELQATAWHLLPKEITDHRSFLDFIQEQGGRPASGF